MLDNSLSEATGKRGLFNYLEGYRQLFLPYKTSNNEWLKTNTKAYIVEAKSDVPEAKAGRTAEGRVKCSVSVYDRYCR